MDTRTMLLEGRYADAVTKFGEAIVREEIDDMIFSDLADKALFAADRLGYTNLARTAAMVVANSGSYGDAAKTLAKKYHAR